MRYDNSNVRRQDRLLDQSEAIELLKSGEYGFLAVNCEEFAYGVPLNYVFSDDRIYIHCSPEGRKLDLLRANDKVSFCVVGPTDVRPAMFTTGYRSVICFGTAEIICNEDEKFRALELIIEKYSPEHLDTGRRYIEKSIGRTAVISISIETVSGKTKV